MVSVNVTVWVSIVNSNNHERWIEISHEWGSAVALYVTLYYSWEARNCGEQIFDDVIYDIFIISQRGCLVCDGILNLARWQPGIQLPFAVMPRMVGGYWCECGWPIVDCP